MTPTIECSAELSCSVCDEELDTITSLHYHQTCHTSEELSLALLAIKGLQQLEDGMGSADSEAVTLKSGMAMHSNFESGRRFQRHCDESTVTAESSTLVAGVATLNGENVNNTQKDNMKVIGMSNRTSSSTYGSSQSESDDEITRKRNNIVRHKIKVKLRNTKIKKKRKNETHFKAHFTSELIKGHKRNCQQDIAETDQYKENVAALLCTSDNAKYESELDQNNSETDTDVELRGLQNMFDPNNEIKLENVYYFSSDSESLPNCRLPHIDVTVPNSIVPQAVSEECERSSGPCEGSSIIQGGTPKLKTIQTKLINITLLDDIEMECSEESNDLDNHMSHNLSTDSDHTSPVKNECISDSSYSPGIILSPNNSPHPERHIQAIISRLPNIVLPEHTLQRSKTHQKHQRIQENFVIPSPVTHYHRSSVRYDYGKIMDGTSQDCGGMPEEENELFQEYFIPNIQLGPMKDQVDVGCSTEVLQLIEKEIQTSTLIVEQEGNLQVKTNSKGGKESENQNNNTNKTENVNKKSQEPQSNTTVRRLALFRKVKVKDNNQEGGRKISVLGSDENAVAKLKVSTTHCTIVATTAEPSISFIKSGIVSSQYHLSNTASNRERFARMYPRSITDRRFFCGPCGKSYKKKSHLERHLRVHTGERPFPCSFCEKRFAVRSILKQHVRIHTGEKPYSCSVCLQRFPQKSGLMTHMMLHTGKPFKCDLCEKSFVSNHKLLQHLRCHDTQSSHPCDVCNMEFFTEGALSEHKKCHAHMKSFVCMMCGANFIQELSLKLHLDEHLGELTHTTIGT